MNQPFKNKVAVVTGAARGIGFAIAERLRADGAEVVMSDVAADGQAVADKIGALFVRGDLRQPADCEQLMAETFDRFGTVHILVNNAGIQHVAPLAEFPIGKWQDMMALMLTAPFLLTRAAFPKMMGQKWGRVINMGSRLSVRGDAYKAAYTTAKHGLLGLTRTTALEGGEHGITAHCICPSWVRTDLMENQIADQARVRGMAEADVVEQVFLADYPIKRMIAPSEVANLVAFLCGQETAVMSGSPIMIDAGSTIS